MLNLGIFNLGDAQIERPYIASVKPDVIEFPCIDNISDSFVKIKSKFNHRSNLSSRAIFQYPAG